MNAKPCPNCGAELPELLKHARMVNCDFCGSSVVLDDDVLRKAGEAGEMLDAPELVTLGQSIRLPDGEFTAHGHVRYDYGRGHWDEYYGQLFGGGASADWAWLSVDEGDLVLQRRHEGATTFGDHHRFKPGVTIELDARSYTCSETSEATAVAFRGQLPEPVAIGDTHRYANFQGTGTRVASIEIWEGGSSVFLGHWIDPFDVET